MISQARADKIRENVAKEVAKIRAGRNTDECCF